MLCFQVSIVRRSVENGTPRQLLLPVDGEAVERDPAVVDVEDLAGAVQDGLVAARPVRPGLRALDRDRRAGGAVAHGGRLLAVDAGREVDRGARGRLLQRRLDRRQRRRGGGPVVGVAPVRTDVERWLRGDGCGARRCRHASVLCLPVEENDGQDGEHRHDDRGQYADEHGASLRRAAVRGGTHTDEVFRSSCDVPWRVRAGRRERCDRKASMGPVTRASLGEERDAGSAADGLAGPARGPEVPGDAGPRTPPTSFDSPRAATRAPERGRRGGGGFHPDVASRTVTLHREFRSATCRSGGAECTACAGHAWPTGEFGWRMQPGTRTVTVSALLAVIRQPS